MKQAIERLINWLAGHGPVVLLAALLVVIGTWGFVELADEVNEGETQTFDEWAVKALRKPDNLAEPIGPTWLAEVGRDLTALGGIAVLLIVTAALSGFLFFVRKYHAMILIMVAVLGGLAISLLLKSSFDRNRPDLVPHLSHVSTSSFPSGHSMMSAVVYLTIGALLTRLTDQQALKVYFLAVAFFITFLVGVSRVYMGVHYPTDVLAGWTAGLVWALICWLVANYLRQRGAVETLEPIEPLKGR